MKCSTSMMAVALASVTLAACGGGGSYDPPAPPPVADNGVPASAQGSVNGLMIFMKTVVASMLESGEPRDTAGVTLPVSDDAEPDGSI